MVHIPVDESYVESLDLALDGIFSGSPVIDQSRYVMSAIARLRHTMMRSRQRRASNQSEQSLPRWLHRCERLGPYEIKLLRYMLYSPGPMIVLKGGAGSGKSSVFGYVHGAVRRAVRLADPDTLPGFGFRQFIVQLDLHQVAGLDLRANDEQVTPDQIDALMSYLATLLSTTFEQLRQDDLGAILVKCYASPEDDEQIQGAHQAVLLKIREHCDPPPSSWAPLSPPDRLKVLRYAIDQLRPADQVMGWLLLYRAIEREINSGVPEQQTWPVVIVLDNIDPLPVLLQQELLHALTRMVSSPVWGNVKLILPMRLSTFERHSLAFTFNVYDHESPDPADLVFTRLVRFLMAPDSLRSFTEAKTEQALVYSQLMALFVHLTDHQSYFRDLLVALAGTNLRRAFHLVHQWCMNSKPPPLHTAQWRAAEFREALLAALGRHALHEFTTSVGRETLDYVRRLEGSEITAGTMPQHTPQIAQGIAKRIGALLRGTEMFSATTSDSRGGPLDDRSLREPFCKAMLEEVRALKAPPNEIAGARSVRFLGPATKTLCHAISRCGESAQRNGLDGRSLQTLIGAVFGAAIDEIRTVAERDPALVSVLCEWFGLVQQLVSTEARSARDWRWIRKQPSSDVGFGPVILPLNSELNRYEAERLLLLPGPGQNVMVHGVLNMFATGKDAVAPVMLRTLYCLREKREVPVKRGELVDFLSLHGYTHDEISTALVSMFNMEHRLIFSGVRDHLEGIDKWQAAADRTVHLSSAGAGYFTVLLTAPAYLQWALWDISSTRAFALSKAPDIAGSQRLVRGRLQAARLGFEHVIEDERRRIQKAWEGHSGTDPRAFTRTAGLTIQNACCDVFFRSIETFMHVYRAHWAVQVGRDREAKGEAEATVQEAREWVELGNKAIADHSRIFGVPVDAWNEALRHAQSDVEKMTLT